MNKVKEVEVVVLGEDGSITDRMTRLVPYTMDDYFSEVITMLEEIKEKQKELEVKP